MTVLDLLFYLFYYFFVLFFLLYSFMLNMYSFLHLSQNDWFSPVGVFLNSCTPIAEESKFDYELTFWSG